jgi:hypothetical protein
MSLFLTLVAAALVAALFYVPAVATLPEASYLHIAAVAVLVLSILAQILSLVRRASPKKGAPKPSAAAPIRAPGAEQADLEAQVVQFLARLQEKGRLVDFVMDDVTSYSNEQVGAAARVVHQGCREVLRSLFDIQPVYPGEEQETANLSGDYDASAYRLVGNIPEHPPYTGTVLHRGWKAVRITLPRLSDDAKVSGAREVIAPAEIEIP